MDPVGSGLLRRVPVVRALCRSLTLLYNRRLSLKRQVPVQGRRLENPEQRGNSESHVGTPGSKADGALLRL